MKKEKKKISNEERFDELRRIKSSGGRLSRIGEWLLAGGSTGWHYDKKDLKYILK